MKPNVDLTENRDFREVGGVGSSFSADSIIEHVINNHHKYLWDDAYTIITSLDSDKDELVYTGNSSVRKMKKFYDEENGDRWNECDRCGSPIKKYAWDKDGSLCKECDELLEMGEEVIPWRRR